MERDILTVESKDTSRVYNISQEPSWVVGEKTWGRRSGTYQESESGSYLNA